MGKDTQSGVIIDGGSPKRTLERFFEEGINFQRENDEIFMNPLTCRGISPIVEFWVRK
jgi:hypothetical protein